MSFDQDLIDLIDRRIGAAFGPIRAVGTCVSRASTGPSADVVLDGSTVAMPTKVLGNVFLRAGDRCVLDLYGTEWVVTGSWSALGLGEASTATAGPAGGTGSLSSSSFVDFSEVSPISFAKAFDNTYVRIGLRAGAYAETSNAAVWFGVRLTPVDVSSSYVAADYHLTLIYFNQTGVHLSAYSAVRLLGIPAGQYTCQLRWRRLSGTGTLKANADDQIMLEVDENVRAAAPYL